MSKIKSFDRATCKALRGEIDTALLTMCKKLGITAKAGNASFSNSEVTFKVTFNVKGADTSTVTDYKRLQKVLGLPDLGSHIKLRNNIYTIVGYKSKARSNNVMIERTDGKKFVCSVDVIKRNLIGGKK